MKRSNYTIDEVDESASILSINNEDLLKQNYTQYERNSGYLLDLISKISRNEE